MASVLTDSRVYFVGDVKKFIGNITKDGVAWDLTNAAVSLILVDPNGGKTTHSCTFDSTPTDGLAYYTTTTSDLSISGQWKRFWLVQDQGSVNDSYGAFVFYVQAVA
jgi:hypothetical protein